MADKHKKDKEAKEILEDLILAELESTDSIPDSWAFLEKKQKISLHPVFESVLRSLLAIGCVKEDWEEKKQERLQPSDEAKQYIELGSPEAQIFHAVPVEGIPKAELDKKLDPNVNKFGFGHAVKQRWIQVDKEKTVRRGVPKIDDVIQKGLEGVSKGEKPENLEELLKRKLVEKSTFKIFSIQKGDKYVRKRPELAGDLTAELLLSGEWKNEEFKAYNFNSLGREIKSGSLHPLMKFREEARTILIGMGFEEMPTNNYVESSFWNFDALFQPQQHPARDSHDTFFLSAPRKTLEIPKEYMERVKAVHEKGGYGSIGYRYDWKVEEAEKNILRTHTTAVSSRMLYALGQGERFVPKKYFSIDRVFRNETLDATHLAEFHQVEGVVADRNLTLGDLIGVIQTFFSKIGISDIRFKPAYNPYTEPSMEVYGYSKALGKWMEVGNSGVFRPEMLQPMGLPEDVRVLAWGLSLERPTMIKYGYKNIRDLFGHKVKLELISKNPVCRF